ncbi:MAG: sigma-70 family RNA polymerase sigma factor [Deltaproteobacteria bacterium]|nr:sigma-70 family RNA polymerase sigma factor [Deltaproteobacteria bacterium]
MKHHRRPDRDDAADFEKVAIENMDRLFATALRLTRSFHDAEDLVQETLVRTFAAYPRIDPNGNMRAYLFRVLTNIFINRYRHRKIVRNVNDMARLGMLDGSLYSSESQKKWSDPHVRYLHSNFSQDVEDALDALPERFRSVLVMADLMDLTYAQIAKELNIPAGTVMSRLFRARRHMRKSLAARDGQTDFQPVKKAASG